MAIKSTASAALFKAWNAVNMFDNLPVKKDIDNVNFFPTGEIIGEVKGSEYIKEDKVIVNYTKTSKYDTEHPRTSMIITLEVFLNSTTDNDENVIEHISCDIVEQGIKHTPADCPTCPKFNECGGMDEEEDDEAEPIDGLGR